MIKFTVPGNPKALKRHRQGKWGTYDPSSGDKADFLAKCMENKPDKPYIGPLRLELIFRFPRPKSHYRTGKFADQLKENAPFYHISTQDIDNLSKFVCDALNKIFWRDDSIITQMQLGKQYSDTPGVIITVTEIGE